VPKPISTSAMIRPVLTMAWTMSIMLLRCIFSSPVKAAVAVVMSALVKIASEDIWIRGAMVGRPKMFDRKPDSVKETIVSVMPRISSKVSPARMTFLIFCGWFWVLYSAKYFVMAVFMPQSRKLAISTGAFMAMEYSP